MLADQCFLMINENYAKKYCCEDISRIENYDLAVNDPTQTWDIHHRRETIYSAQGLIEIGEYYHRPAAELIFLTPSEHRTLHKRGKNNPFFGKHHSAETLEKLSEANLGKHLSAETKQQMSKAHLGKHHSAETRTKMSEARRAANRGNHWWNNGAQNKFSKECPGPEWKQGRLKWL